MEKALPLPGNGYHGPVAINKCFVIASWRQVQLVFILCGPYCICSIAFAALNLCFCPTPKKFHLFENKGFYALEMKGYQRHAWLFPKYNYTFFANFLLTSQQMYGPIQSQQNTRCMLYWFNTHVMEMMSGNMYIRVIHRDADHCHQDPVTSLL